MQAMTTVSPREHFTDAQTKAVEDAIAAAESKTSCELVVAVVPRADRYDRAADLVGLGGGLVLLAAGSAVTAGLTNTTQISGSWAATTTLPIGLAPAIGLVLLGVFGGVAVARAFPQLAMLFVPRRVRDQACRQAAESLSHRLRVRRTADATGLFVLVSMLERIVEVIPDERTAAEVDQSAFDGAATAIARGFKERRGPEALAEAIETLGDRLATTLPRGEGDTDELPNRLHLIEE